MTDDATDDGDGTDVSTRTADLTYETDGTEPPSEAVVRAVASLTNTPVLDLEPLYGTVDPRHLDGVFERTGAGGGDALEEASVSFDFGGCRVTVTRDAVHVRERAGDDG